jgi:hypothetical protein
MIGGPKLSSFKIGGPKLQKIENRNTKTAIKPFIYLQFLIPIHFYFVMILLLSLLFNYLMRLESKRKFLFYGTCLRVKTFILLKINKENRRE